MRLRHPAVLLAVCLGYFMAVLDATIVNVSLPDMARGFGAGVAGMQWVVDGYALVFASLLLTMGAVGDRWGNKETFVAGLGLFTLASALCGVAPSIAALGALTFALIQGGVWGWSSPPVVGMLVVATVAGVLFYRGERRSAYPMLPLGLFADRTFSAGNAVGAILSFGFYGELFLMSLFLQQVQHRSPLSAGLALLPQTAAVSVMNFVSGRITARRGPRPPMVAGLALGGAGLP